MAFLGFLGPEFVFQLALGQWTTARRSVADFKSSGYPHWSMQHAFLSDMGGFVLHAQDFVPFPLNAKQVHYLVAEGYIPYSAVGLDKNIIGDKNKGDGMVRFLTACQILWFSVNCIGRAMQHLAITTLELTTLGFILCTLGTSFCWAHKPMDVGTAIVLKPNTTLRNILINAGDRAREPYKNTPLDFIDREHWSWSLYWSYWMNILRKFHIKFGVLQRPIDRIPDDNFPPITQPGSLTVLFIFHITYGAIHLGGWNFQFPTPIERTLWHAFTLVVLVSIVLTWMVQICAWHILPACREHRSVDREGPYSGLTPKSGFRGIVHTAAASLRNNSLGHDPTLDVPLKALIPVTAAGACYCLARAYIFIESFVNLRALPQSAYSTINWFRFWPHF
jgi:hypothetical protein